MRFAEGCTSITRLHSELVAEHASVTYAMVRVHIATLRGAPSAALPRPPTVRQVTGRLTRHPTALNEEDRVALKDVLTRCPELEAAADTSAISARCSTAASAARSLPGSTQSMPAGYPVSPASQSSVVQIPTGCSLRGSHN